MPGPGTPWRWTPWRWTPWRCRDAVAVDAGGLSSSDVSLFAVRPGITPSPAIRIPGVEALASNASAFPFMYGYRLCCPTRAALPTGHLPMRYGMVEYVGMLCSIPCTESLLIEHQPANGKRHIGGKGASVSIAWEDTFTLKGGNSFVCYYDGSQDHAMHEVDRALDLRNDSLPNCGECCSRAWFGADGRHGNEPFAAGSVRLALLHNESGRSCPTIRFQDRACVRAGAQQVHHALLQPLRQWPGGAYSVGLRGDVGWWERGGE